MDISDAQKQALVDLIYEDKTPQDVRKDTMRALVKKGFVTDEGVTSEGVAASGVDYEQVPTLRLKSPYVIQGVEFPKGTVFLILWANRKHRNRRNWWYKVQIRTESDRTVDFTLTHSPRFEFDQVNVPKQRLDNQPVSV